MISREVIPGVGDYERGFVQHREIFTYDCSPPQPIKYNASVVFILHL